MAFQTRRDTTNQLNADEIHKQYIRLSPTSIAFQNQRDTTYLVIADEIHKFHISFYLTFNQF